MYLVKKNEHTIALFINVKILSINLICYKTLSELMHDVSTASAPIYIRNLFTKTCNVHSYNTRSSTSENFYIKASSAYEMKFSPTFLFYNIEVYDPLIRNFRV